MWWDLVYLLRILAFRSSIRDVIMIEGQREDGWRTPRRETRLRDEYRLDGTKSDWCANFDNCNHSKRRLPQVVETNLSVWIPEMLLSSARVFDASRLVGRSPVVSFLYPFRS